MPIYRLLQNTSFGPEHISIIAAAFESVCRELHLAEREDPLRDLVAEKILECAQKGELDPAQLEQCAREALRGH